MVKQFIFYILTNFFVIAKSIHYSTAIIASEVSFLVCSTAWIFHIYMFQAIHRSVNVATCI